MRTIIVNQELETESPFLTETLPELLEMVCEILIKNNADTNQDFDIVHNRIMEYDVQQSQNIIWGIVAVENTGRLVTSITIDRVWKK